AITSFTITQNFKEIEQSVDENEAVYKILQNISTRWNNDIINIITTCIHNSTSSLSLKTAATQMLEKAKQYIGHIYDKTAFITAILDPRIKLELILDNINTLEN
ncbi:12273_t:CDS:2, partial [Cetraspora pellucida]